MSESKTRRFTRRQALVASTQLLAVGVGASILSACGGAPAAAPTAPPKAAGGTTPAPAGEAKPTTAPAAAEKPSAGAVTIQWITPAGVGLERDFYTSFKDDFMKRNPNIKVEVSYEGWDDYFIKIATIFAGGAIPDVNHLHLSIVQDYGTRGVMRNMFEYLDRDKVARDMYFKPLIFQMSDYKSHTKLWAVPKDSATYCIYYNKDLFDKAGVPYPKPDWTFEDFREKAKLLTVDKNGNRADSAKFDRTQIGQWGFQWIDPLPSGDSMNQLTWDWVGPWFNDDFTKANFDKPEYVEFVQFFADMRCKDRSIPAAGDALGQGDPWRNQLTAMVINHHQGVFFYNADKKTFKFDVVYTPRGKGGQWSCSACSGYGVPVKAKYPDQGWDLVKFLTSDEKQCEIVKAKRWGSATVNCEKNLIPDDGNPPSFRQVLVDPMYKAQGMPTDIKVEAKGLIFPPYQNDMKQIWKTEFDAVSNCGGVTAAEAAKKAQPQIQALLDKAARG